MIITVSCVLVLSCMPVVTLSSYVVETPAGRIKGAEATANNEKKYVAFRNIPYAKPPLGNLRFAKPEPHPKFEDTLDASKEFITTCPQPDQLLFVDDGDVMDGTAEDCLVLNVFVPQLDRGARKVMVFIHGGGFVVGGSAPLGGGSFVTDHDVVLVTINYRLSVLGFLSLENEASPGNYGLWDQVLAIKWVKDNIASFGGDPDDITISGESAGSAAVTYLCLTSATKGLFTKAYPQSGTASSVFARAIGARTHALTYAKLVNCWDGEVSAKIDEAQSQRVMECLRSLPSSEMTKFTDFRVSEAQFVPRVDGDFLPRPPLDLLHDVVYLESVGFFHRSYLFGVVNNERGIMEGALDMIDNVIRSANGTSEEEKRKQVSEHHEAVIDFYVKSRLGTNIPPAKVKANVADWYRRREGDRAEGGLITDLSFIIPAYDFLEALARRGPTQAWLLYFNHFPHFMKGQQRGLAHGVDMNFWMDVPLDALEAMVHCGAEGEMDHEDLQLKTLFSSIIAEFMRSGNPNLALRDLLPSGWPIFNLPDSHYLDFNLEPSVKRRLEGEKRDLWLKKVPEWAKHHVHTEL